MFVVKALQFLIFFTWQIFLKGLHLSLELVLYLVMKCFSSTMQPHEPESFIQRGFGFSEASSLYLQRMRAGANMCNSVTSYSYGSMSKLIFKLQYVFRIELNFLVTKSPGDRLRSSVARELTP